MKKKTISSLIKLNQFILVAALCFTGTAVTLNKREEYKNLLKKLEEEKSKLEWQLTFSRDMYDAYENFPGHIKELFNGEDGYDLHYAYDFDALDNAYKEDADFTIAGFTRYNPKEIYVGNYHHYIDYNTIFEKININEEKFEKSVLDIFSDFGYNDVEDYDTAYQRIQKIDTFYHEVGHAIYHDYVKKDYNLSNEFFWSHSEDLENFKKSGYHLVIDCGSEHNVENMNEYFATCFACYMIYPESLQESAPRTYNLMDQIYNSSLESGKVLSLENK